MSFSGIPELSLIILEEILLLLCDRNQADNAVCKIRAKKKLLNLTFFPDENIFMAVSRSSLVILTPCPLLLEFCLLTHHSSAVY